MSKVDLRPFKFKTYKQDMILKGDWEFQLKIDGVMAIQTETGWVSRANKALLHIPKMPNVEVAEIYLGDFESSISAVHTIDGKEIGSHFIFSLAPSVDKRLHISTMENPSSKDVSHWLTYARRNKYEGLILVQNDVRIKVKPIETYDVEILALQPGTGKHRGKLGAFITTKGKIGTGLTDKQRELYNNYELLGRTIEVSCMELTKDDKFRHPRFVRFRPDK